ncbi:MAG: hypothetical protein L6R42_002408 [Xanthoria sp. 1 TBL-2021]|nr:MAG: hypothetical protein L6R42_002408 [Xanthoria sp. 1 TBL-2021]
MSKKSASIFESGWTPAKAAVLNSTKLPDKTRCKVCHKIKAISNYSNKQQLELKQKLAGALGEKAKSPIAEIIVCKQCTPGPISPCEQPADFDKRCLLCVNDHVTEPWAHVDHQEGLEEEPSDEDDSDTRSTTNPYSGASYRPGSEVNSAISGLRAFDLSEHDKWHSPEKKKGSTVATESDLLGSYSESGKGKGKQKENIHKGYGSPSTTGSERSVQIITDDYTQKGGFARPQKAGNTGFANPPPGPPQRRPDDIIDHLKASATGRVVSYDDETDSDSDGSFGML